MPPSPRPLGVSIGRSREAAGRLIGAHAALLRAELAVTGRQIGLIVGLAVAAMVLAALMVTLLYVGTWLFVGEWLFGSLGWGVVHGTLFSAALMVPIGLDLAGGSVRAWSRGLLVGALVTIACSALFASNVLRDAAVSAGDALEASLALEPALLPTLVGAVVGALVVGLGLFVVGLRAGGAFRLLVIGVVLGILLGAILGSVTFDASGAVAVGLTVGLVAWIASSVLVAARRGFDPAARYDLLVPRESMAALEGTKSFVRDQWQRQRRKLVGR